METSMSENMIFIKGNDEQMDKIAKTLKHLPKWINQKHYLRDLGVVALQQNRKRIARQEMQDGSKMPSRKNQSGKNQTGKKKKTKSMFQKLRMRKQYSLIPILSNAGEKFVKIKFKRRYLERMARFHQHGITQTIKDEKTGKSWKIPREKRDILVINNHAQDAVMTFLNTRLQRATQQGF